MKGSREMASMQELERCPECWQAGYSYDRVCKIWCCGRCHSTETVEEKGKRDALCSVLSAPAEGAAEASWPNERAGDEAALPMSVQSRS